MKVIVTLAVFLFLAPAIKAQQQLVITTEPNAIVWIDDVRRGTTDFRQAHGDESDATPHTIRVRANGFKGNLGTARRGPPRDLSKARADDQRGRVDVSKSRDRTRISARRCGPEKAADLYREAIKLNPSNAPAHVGLARVLLDLGSFNDALDAIDAARQARPNMRARAQRLSKGASIGRKATSISDPII